MKTTKNTTNFLALLSIIIFSCTISINASAQKPSGLHEGLSNIKKALFTLTESNESEDTLLAELLSHKKKPTLMEKWLTSSSSWSQAVTGEFICTTAQQSPIEKANLSINRNNACKEGIKKNKEQSIVQ
jgi:hypothetical protein